jgi:uncharacterized protein YjbI with pentapeptide repeats
MADPNHCAIVRVGGESLIEWRRKHQGERLDLSEADLHGADLRKISLEFADLRKANLSNANLEGASLVAADASEANLTNANMTDAALLFADLSRAVLQGTTFNDANLMGANLTDCRFDGASFKGAALTRTVISKSVSTADLEGARLTYIGLGRLTQFPLSSLIPSEILEGWAEVLRKGRPTSLELFALALRVYSVMTKVALRTVLRTISWPIARHFGNLTLLTRASYLLLVIVPILAGLWPIIARTVSTYDAAVDKAAAITVEVEQLNQTITNRLAQRSVVLDSNLFETVNRLDTRVTELREMLHHAKIGPPRFPRTFAALFFAALFAAFGHLLYQLWADSLVKETTERKHVETAVGEFNPADADSRIKLDKALYFIMLAALKYPDEVHRNLVEESGRLVWLPNRSEEFEGLPEHVRIVAIERAAILEYENAARKAPVAAVLSLVFYLASAALILWVIYTQSREVLTATGIL